MIFFSIINDVKKQNIIISISFAEKNLLNYTEHQIQNISTLFDIVSVTSLVLILVFILSNQNTLNFKLWKFSWKKHKRFTVSISSVIYVIIGLCIIDGFIKWYFLYKIQFTANFLHYLFAICITHFTIFMFVI